MKKTLLILITTIFSQLLFSQHRDSLEFPKTIKLTVSEVINKYLFLKNNENLKELDSIKTLERVLF